MRARDVTLGDWHGWADGTHDAAYEILGAHPTGDGEWDIRVWAPNATAVSVVGDWNGWDINAAPMLPSDTGVWSARVRAEHGQRYKFRLRTVDGVIDKADPFAFHAEQPPNTASVLWDLHYDWDDDDWMATRAERQALDQPIAVYELHLGSWDRRDESGSGEPVNYRTLAPRLIEHVNACGFTHVELMPVMEHPFYGSWGYQTTSYFAPTCRYGSPQDFKAMIDLLHRENIGVILDWVPSHFPEDAFALGKFDGTHLFEHADRRLGFHPDWKSLIFNYGRAEVRSFLISSARFWIREFHADGIRVDAVASMLYRDYSRNAGEWYPNEFGGNENLEAIDFMQQLNRSLYHHHPDIHMIAEESTAWPGVTQPVDLGGLGFGMKWDMGWMHDTLSYISQDPINRRYHHREITFRSNWAFTENYMLPLSHDEVVHGKGSLIGKMPGDDWQRVANLRLVLGWQWAQPGKKLLFMGNEIGQWTEWDHDGEVPWRPGHPDRPPHADQVQAWVSALNQLYRQAPSLHRSDVEAAGFEWLIGDDYNNSVVAFLRHDVTAVGSRGADVTLVVANFTPVPRENYAVGVPVAGEWTEALNSDWARFGGSDVTNRPENLCAVDEPAHNQTKRLRLTLPPLALLLLRPGADNPANDAPANDRFPNPAPDARPPSRNNQPE